MDQHKKLRILFVAIVIITIWMLPIPDGIKTEAWHLFAIFFGVIFAIIIHALPMGAASLIGLILAVATNTLSFKSAFSSYSDPIVWLVVGAFFIAHGFIDSGLGERIAYRVMSIMGRSILGLGYGIAFAETILAMAIPSATARTGGIIYPVVRSLIDSIGDPNAKADQESINGYLMQTAFQVAVISSTMFLTGMAGNPLIVKLASNMGMEITWSSWALAAIVPGLVSMLILPYFLKCYFKPVFRDDALLLELTKDKFGSLGPMTEKERLMAVIFILLLLLWIFGALIGLSAAISVLIGVSLMIITNVVVWKDLLKLSSAWNTFVWFGALLALASGMSDLGLSVWFGNFVAGYLSDFSVILALAGLLVIYFYSHYFFASITAHIGAMLLPFLLVALNLEVSPILITFIFAFASNLMGGLTHYSFGPAPILYGAGFVKLTTWWKVGFYVSLINIVTWLVFGLIWWKIIGLY